MHFFRTFILLVGAVALSAAAPGERPKAQGKHWAVLVAGSSSWENYRHQADVCHAYQIMHSHGIPDERIIVMMYDDIAQNHLNPTPGIVINRPNGPDVYKGVPKDYTGKHVTPENFMAVLEGRQTNGGSGKVLKSGPDDHVFVYFTDHGAPGIIAFPEKMLKAKQLNAALNMMHQKKMYKQLVFYLEACESGSMFKKLSKDINIYATTAANSTESSYAIYFDKKRETYLGDVYSVKWMEDSDKEDLKTETLQQQFTVVKRETNTSHVHEFGDMSIGKETVAQFQGGVKGPTPARYVTDILPSDAVASGDVPLAILDHRLVNAQSLTERNAILEEMRVLLQSRERIRDTVHKIVHEAVDSADQATRVLQMSRDLNNFDCYDPMVDFFDAKCFKLPQTEYAMRHLYTLVNLCEEGVAPLKILNAMSSVC